MIILRVPAESRRSFAALQDDMASRDHRGERNGDSLKISKSSNLGCESPFLSPSIPQSLRVIPKLQRGISKK